MSLFVTLLQVLFVGLKLTNVIAWSWVWVLAPLWIWAILSILIFTIVLVIAIFQSQGR